MSLLPANDICIFLEFFKCLLANNRSNIAPLLICLTPT